MGVNGALLICLWYFAGSVFMLNTDEISCGPGSKILIGGVKVLSRVRRVGEIPGGWVKVVFACGFAVGVKFLRGPRGKF